jgi:hypothetical protein
LSVVGGPVLIACKGLFAAKPLKLTSDRRSDLVEFLRALTGDTWQNIEAPDKLAE